ncbi:MAG: hypothetical protein ABEH58_06610 [Haloplanus sp.]
MGDVDEKRVHDDRRDGAAAYVAADAGLVRVALAGDRIGRFGMARREPVRDVALVEGTLVAAGEDVTADGEMTGFGAAVAVGDDGRGTLVAADADGAVARRTDDGWWSLGTVADVRAVAGGLVAAAGGVHRVLDNGLVPAGLDDARDVAGGERPLAATSDGLYALGNGWLDLLDGPFRAVAAAPDGRAAAVGDAVHAGPATADDWTRVSLPESVDPGDVVDVGFAADARYAVTADGVVLADAGDGWRTRSLGVDGVRRLAVRDAPAAEQKGV